MLREPHIMTRHILQEAFLEPSWRRWPWPALAIDNILPSSTRCGPPGHYYQHSSSIGMLLECQITVGAAYKYHLLLLLILIIECAAGERSIVPVVGQVDFFNINNHATHRGQASLSHVPHSRQRG